MEKVHSLLLNLFANNERFGIDAASLHKRFQVISLIYISLGTDIIIIIFNIVTGLFYNNPYPYLMSASTLPFSVLGYFSLKMRKPETTGAALLIKLHISNIIGCYSTNNPLAALYAIMVYPTFSFFLTSSTRMHYLNAVFCGLEFFYNAMKIREIFEVTLTDEQARQILTQVIAGGLCIATTCIVAMIQKRVELNAWALAQENHRKSENLNKDLVEAIESKDKFVSMLSHEIRNPLNSLKGSIDYLLGSVTNHNHIQILRNAKLSGEILLNLLNNLLDAAKLKSDKMEISNSETNISEIVKKVFVVNSERLKEKEITARAYIDEDFPRVIWTDPSRLMQILMNLVSNATKFTERRGEIKIKVIWYSLESENLLKQDTLECIPRMETEIDTSYCTTARPWLTQNDTFEEFNLDQAKTFYKNLKTAQKPKHKHSNNLKHLSDSLQIEEHSSWSINLAHFDKSGQAKIMHCPSTSNANSGVLHGYLKVQVTDTGCGIAETDLPKLFGMFEQVAQGSRSVHGGTGLGLWISKQLCTKMGGDITVFSQLSKGTSFVLYIPVNCCPVSPEMLPKNIKNNKKLKALVVDDYSVNRYTHKLLLEQQEISVVTANNGREAVEKYTTQSDADFILMDVHMPEMDGFTAAVKIREWEKEKKKPNVDIYFVTGEYFNEREVMTEFKSLGGSEAGIKCIKKPIDSDTIKNILKYYK